MDKKSVAEIISDMQENIDMLLKCIDNIEVCRFYAGKMSVLSKELLLLIKDI